MKPSLSEWVNSRLKEKNLSMRGLARAAGISQPQISLVLKGTRKPTRDFCAAISKVLEVDEEFLYWLAGLEESEPVSAVRYEPGMEDLINVARELDPDQRAVAADVLRALKERTLQLYIPKSKGDKRANQH